MKRRDLIEELCALHREYGVQSMNPAIPCQVYLELARVGVKMNALISKLMDGETDDDTDS